MFNPQMTVKKKKKKRLPWMSMVPTFFKKNLLLCSTKLKLFWNEMGEKMMTRFTILEVSGCIQACSYSSIESDNLCCNFVCYTMQIFQYCKVTTLIITLIFLKNYEQNTFISNKLAMVGHSLNCFVYTVECTAFCVYSI